MTVQAVLGGTGALVRRGGLRAAIALASMTGIAALADSITGGAELNFVAAAVSFGMLYWLTGALLEDLGRLPRAGRVGAAVGLCLLTNIGTLAGFVFLIVPGIILLVRWSISLVWLLGEDSDVSGAISGSWEATRDSFWPIFLTQLLLFVPGLASALIVAILDFRGIGGVPGFIVTDGLMAASQIAQWHAAVAIYLLLRPGNELAELFA